jgi:hypothetical protein
MDNQTLCNQGIIDLNDVHTGRIYSHIDYHVNKIIEFELKYFAFFYRINIFISKIIIVQLQ